jgi:hypothetical protein
MDKLEIPAALREVGEHLFSLPDLPSDCRGVTVSVSRDALPEGDVAHVTIEARRSPVHDWQACAHGTLPGGAILTPRKAVAMTSELEYRWPTEADGRGGVRPVRAADARVRLVVLQPFTAALTLRAS